MKQLALIVITISVLGVGVKASSLLKGASTDPPSVTFQKKGGDKDSKKKNPPGPPVVKDKTEKPKEPPKPKKP